MWAFPHILLCWPSHGLSLLRWHRLCIRDCFFGLGHHSSIVWSLVFVSNISSVAWLWCNDRWCQSRLQLLGDQSYDAIRSMGCPRCITIGGTWTGSIWIDGIQVSILGIDEVKLLGLQYGLFFRLGTFRCNFLCDGREQSLEEPIQKDPVIKLDLAQAATPSPLIDMIRDVSGGVLVTG